MSTVFDTIKDRLPITEVLSTYITLIPSGSQFKAKCPFHTERSASFSVSPDRGLYYCFGCGAKGDIFTFVEQFEGVDRKGALKILADRAGVVLTNTVVQKEHIDDLYDILESTTIHYEQSLAQHTEALDYMYSRGITDATIKAFRIGYAPDEWRFITQSLKSDGDIMRAVRVGLIKQTEKGYYDRFRKRVMFPLCDTTGRVIAFSGRLFPSEESDTQNPKYLNSPETELFQKSRILFCFDKAKTAIRQHNFAIVVEGQFDCVLAHQAGFKNTVATSGTAISDVAALDQKANLVVLARLTPNVFFAFDGDSAGQKALDHAAIIALRLGMNPKVVPLPIGMDPADYIQAHGAEGLKSLLKESKHFILHQAYMIERTASSAHVLKDMVMKKIFPYLALVPALERKKYIDTIVAESNIGSSVGLNEDFLQYQKNTTQSEVVENYTPERQKDTITFSERFVAITELFTEEVQLHETQLREFQFNNERIVLPTLGEEKKDFIFARVLDEYKNKTSEERKIMFDEVVKKIIDDFFRDLQFNYSLQMNNARLNNDEETETKFLALLQEIYRRRHADT